ncbi:hypothetical protein WJM97_21260 [Okeanomitos corallinicola TIOX110]|uniref:Uncharacterized protein n=1 Tax=Okeanomitos corallinicola TIOX110 TaxID=3133117 RepID=A0ABZ2UU17_9CYAN
MLNQAHKLDQLQTLAETQERTESSVTKKSINISNGPNAVDKDTYTEQRFLPECIRLNFDELKAFETLHDQFKNWGIIFDNCLVIQPSNPAFPSESGSKVVMASPKSGLLEINFLRPVNWVSGLVTSSQRLVISAYDQNGELLDESVLPKANLANSDSDIPPNTMLSVSAENISKVKFFCFDGNFTLDEFRFCISN